MLLSDARMQFASTGSAYPTMSFMKTPKPVTSRDSISMVGEATRSPAGRRGTRGVQLSYREGAEAYRFHGPGADQANTGERLLH